MATGDVCPILNPQASSLAGFFAGTFKARKQMTADQGVIGDASSVEVTEEMVAAGVSVLAASDPPYDLSRDIVTEIFRAMALASYARDKNIKSGYIRECFIALSSRVRQRHSAAEANDAPHPT